MTVISPSDAKQLGLIEVNEPNPTKGTCNTVVDLTIEQPVPSVTVTLYVSALKSVIDEPVAPLDHK